MRDFDQQSHRDNQKVRPRIVRIIRIGSSLNDSLAITLLACLILSCAAVACVESKADSICGADPNADFIANDEAVINPRLEGPQAGLHSANAIWVRDGESLTLEWDRVDIHFTKKTEECHFESLTTFNENCRVCDICGNGNPDLCGFLFPIADPQSLTVIPLKLRRGLTSSGEIIVDDTLLANSACTTPRQLTPTETSTVELYKPLAACDAQNSPPILSRVVHVIKADNQESVKFQLEMHTETKPAMCVPGGMPDCQTVWYRFTMPDDPVWSNNFSANVRIGPVHIKKYKKDPQSGQLSLIEEVRPSRIVLLSDFQGNTAVDASGNLANDGNRCFALPEAQRTGDQPYIDFSECHAGSPNGSNFGNIQLVTATPTKFDDGNNATVNDRPTWFVEFNDAGLEASPRFALGANEFLFIEFVIVPV
jgi:hypothetical protein